MIKNINQGKKEIIRITRYGPIKLVFPKEDNSKAVNTVLDNLLTSYEKKMIICQLIKEIRVYKDYNIEIEFNISYRQFLVE